MWTIAAFTAKGGSGKTTLTREISVELTRRGLVVAVQDLDLQLTLTNWVARREPDTPVLVPRDTPRDALVDRCDVLMIDAAPGTTPPQCDFLAIVVRPTPEDIEVASALAASLPPRQAWAFILSQCPPRSRLTADAARPLSEIGFVCPTPVFSRVDYPSRAVTGDTAVEAPKTKAAAEIRAVVDFVLQNRGGGNA